jgi:hypothetical protein
MFGEAVVVASQACHIKNDASELDDASELGTVKTIVS